MRRNVYATAALVALLAVLMGAGGAKVAESPRAAHKVTRIIDGDTIEVEITWASFVQLETVRLTGVDAPERGEVYSAESATFLTNLLKGDSVYLTFESGDEKPSRDRYGRIIASVYRAPDGMDVCLELVRQGYARAWDGVSTRRREFSDIEAGARSRGKGLWAVGGDAGG